MAELLVKQTNRKIWGFDIELFAFASDAGAETFRV